MQQLEVPEQLRESQEEEETADVGDIENQQLLASTQLLCLKPNAQTPFLPCPPHIPKYSKNVKPTNNFRSKTVGNSVQHTHCFLFRSHFCEKSSRISKFVLNPHTSKFSDTQRPLKYLLFACVQKRFLCIATNIFFFSQYTFYVKVTFNCVINNTSMSLFPVFWCSAQLTVFLQAHFHSSIQKNERDRS